jgi:hypothetical protein
VKQLAPRFGLAVMLLPKSYRITAKWAGCLPSKWTRMPPRSFSSSLRRFTTAQVLYADCREGLVSIRQSKMPSKSHGGNEFPHSWMAETHNAAPFGFEQAIAQSHAIDIGAGLGFPPSREWYPCPTDHLELGDLQRPTCSCNELECLQENGSVIRRKPLKGTKEDIGNLRGCPSVTRSAVPRPRTQDTFGIGL